MEKTNVTPQEHHLQKEFCLTRPKYRQGKKLIAVKAYTVNHESKYILVYGVPSIKIENEFENLCGRYGDAEVKPLPDYPTEEYTECYLVKYDRIKSARFAKKQLDGKSFFGGVLHVCYAPELETIDETREKLQERRKVIAALTRYQENPTNINIKKKRTVDLGKKSAVHRCMSRWNVGEASKLKNTLPDHTASDYENLPSAGEIESETLNILCERTRYEFVDSEKSQPKTACVNNKKDQETNSEEIQIQNVCVDNKKEEETKRKVTHVDNKYQTSNRENKKIKLFGNTKNILSFKKT